MDTNYRQQICCMIFKIHRTDCVAISAPFTLVGIKFKHDKI